MTNSQLFNSLPLLLLAVVAGVTSVSGAAIGGMLLMLLPLAASARPELGGLFFLGIGLAAVGLGRDSNGVASRLFALGRWRRWRLSPARPVLLSQESVPS